MDRKNCQYNVWTLYPPKTRVYEINIFSVTEIASSFFCESIKIGQDRITVPLRFYINFKVDKKGIYTSTCKLQDSLQHLKVPYLLPFRYTYQLFQNSIVLAYSNS